MEQGYEYTNELEIRHTVEYVDQDTGGFCGRWSAGVIAWISRERSWNQQAGRSRLLLRDHADTSSLTVVNYMLTPVPLT